MIIIIIITHALTFGQGYVIIRYGENNMAKYKWKEYGYRIEGNRKDGFTYTPLHKEATIAAGLDKCNLCKLWFDDSYGEGICSNCQQLRLFKR